MSDRQTMLIQHLTKAEKSQSVMRRLQPPISPASTAVWSALVRSLAITLPAAVLAIAVAVALSPLGPVGMGRAGEIDPGVQVDGVVLVLGALALAATVTLAVIAPVIRGRVLRPAAPVVPRSSSV